MYLSRLQLNPTSRTLWRNAIDQPYKLHQLVMQGFPDGVCREDAHVLHRLDTTTNSITLLVQSDIQPDWKQLDNEFLLPSDPFDPHPNPAIQELSALDLQPGRTLRFRLRANPTKRLSTGKGNKPGPRVELYQEQDQLDWLQRKADLHGFRLLTADITPHGKATDWAKNKQDSQKRHKLTLFTVQFDGLLHITDADKFHHALTHGIGPAKAFGCGLLSLAPAG